MRLKGLKPTRRNEEAMLRARERSAFETGLTSGVFVLPDALSPRARVFAKIRVRHTKFLLTFGSACGRIFKRWMDVCGSLAAIVLLMPLFIVSAIWLKLDSPGPLFYRQVRICL